MVTSRVKHDATSLLSEMKGLVENAVKVVNQLLSKAADRGPERNIHQEISSARSWKVAERVKTK